MTDAIKICWGTFRLIRLVNRFGVCASKDTHDRYVQYRVEKLTREEPMNGLPLTSFLLASIDNLDYKLAFAHMFCGIQESSSISSATTLQA